MKTLVLGDGLLARSIRDADPDNVVTAGHDRFDIRDYDSLVRLFADEQPDLVVNTVAFHRLADCEKDPRTATAVNARGAERVAQILHGQTPYIFISTDYVFTDGGPHDESIPGQQPRSVYGRTKLAGELGTLEYDGCVVRVSGLFGHHPSHKGLSFPDLIATKFDKLTLPKDQTFSPTYAPDAAAKILLITDYRGIYHAANAGSTTWAEFGLSIRSALNRRFPRIDSVAQHDPIRPKNSALKSTRIQPGRHWIVALDEWRDRRDHLLFANREVSPLRSAR